MKQIEIKEYGGPEVLQTSEADIPSAGPGQVLIKVVAAGINRPDIFQRMGLYPPPEGASDIPGLEVAGEVVDINGSFDFPKVGDNVCALLDGGGYAEFAIAEASLCLPVPKGLSPIEAAALPETTFTVWSNVFDRAQLKENESFLVHGGSSGIGTMAIQMAKAHNASVYTTAGSQKKCDVCLELGADLAINYHESDFVEVITDATNGKGVDVILDMVCGEYINKNIKLAANDGRIVVIAGLNGYKTEFDILPIMRKRLSLTGSTLRARPVAFKADIARNLKQHIWPLIEKGKIKPVIYESLPLDRAQDAHSLMQSSQHIGKIILVN
jgi:NADPH2:quinone reductase